jgi:iron-sulfur cluster assembly protein
MVQITLSENAASKLRDLMAKPDPQTGKSLGSADDTYLRVYIAGGGCSGFKYGLALDRNVREGDEVVQTNGIKVVVDQNSTQYLDGSSVDYMESVAGSGFMVSNPNNWSTCGCGQSFNPKGEAAPDAQEGHHGHGAHAHSH